METLRRIAAVSCSVLLLAIVFVYVDNIGRQVYSQQTTENVFPNNTETATEFEDVIEGNNTAALENNTNIGNPNNTLSSDVVRGAETLESVLMVLGEDAKVMLKNEIDNIDQMGKQDFDALLAKIRSLQIP